MPNNSNKQKTKKPFYKRKRYIIPAVIVLLILIRVIYKHAKGTTYDMISVTSGSITETVSVTGNTTPTQSVSLGFQNAGTIAAVNYDVGDHVPAGAVIASLNTSDLSASLKQAEANVDAENAKLEGLNAGAQPQDIAASQAALQKAQQDLANMYAGISDASNNAYSKASDAVYLQLNQVFTFGQSANPQLSFQTTDSQAENLAESKRITVGTELTAWQKALGTVSAASSQSDLTALLADNVKDLSDIRDLLATVSTALNAAPGTDPSLATYKANVSTATSEVTSALSTLNAIPQNIASQNLTVNQLQAELALKQAGSTESDIAAQEAEVEQAEASVAAAQAKLADAEIVAPISGTITQQDAKVGQVASPSTPLVSIISNGAFEVDADVPETDIGKLAVGDAVSMTFDAFPNETFTGKVFYIDPAETINQGVVDYKIKVSFDTPDARMKSGLTSNLDITTKTHDNALILPQYAILTNDKGTFVETLAADKKTVQTDPVTLGIQDENGNVEILSGVTAGEQVLNIGLKTGS